MNVTKYHSISSSEGEEEDYEGIDITGEKISDGFVKPETLKDILSKVKGVKYDFSEVLRSSQNPILYSKELTEDMEIWVVQTPKEVNVESLKEADFKFDEFSQATLNIRKRKKRYNVHTIESVDEKINCVLPRKKTESFHMELLPIRGTIILQEDFQIDSVKRNLDEIATNSSSAILELNFDDSRTPEIKEIMPLKKRRKSVKQDSVLN